MCEKRVTDVEQEKVGGANRWKQELVGSIGVGFKKKWRRPSDRKRLTGIKKHRAVVLTDCVKMRLTLMQAWKRGRAVRYHSISI